MVCGLVKDTTPKNGFRSFLTGLLLSSKVEDLSTGLEFDIVIVILLHCAHTGAGLNNAV